MEEKYGFIYITINNINGKKYIGQKKYIKGWEDYLGSGIVLNNAIKKYGREYFTRQIIEECITREETNEREKYWITYYNAVKDKMYYNIALGGDGGNTISGYNQEQLEKLSKTKSKALKGIINQGANNPNAKKVICLNTMEIFNTTVEAAKNFGITDNSIQQACSEKSKVRTSGYDLITGEKLLWEYYDLNKKYEYIPFKINTRNTTTKVMCINTNEIFNSIREASERYNVEITKISHNCSHFTTFGGIDKNGNCLYWIKYDEYLNNGIDEKYYQRDKIQQFDINGNLLNTFRIFKDAVDETGFTYERIKRNIQGITKSTGGFIFKEKYKDVHLLSYKQK